MRAATVLVILAGFALIGCSKEYDTYRFEIKSNVSWNASYEPVGGHPTSISGDGNKTIKVNEPPPVCITIDGIGSGFIEVTAYKHVRKSGIFTSDDNRDIAQDAARTEDPSGEVGACTQ